MTTSQQHHKESHQSVQTARASTTPAMAARAVGRLAAHQPHLTPGLARQLATQMATQGIHACGDAADALLDAIVLLRLEEEGIGGVTESLKELSDEALTSQALHREVIREFEFACVSAAAESAGLATCLGHIGALSEPEKLFEALMALLVVRVNRLAACLGVDCLLAFNEGWPVRQSTN